MIVTTVVTVENVHIIKLFKCIVDIFSLSVVIIKLFHKGALLTCKVWHNCNTQNTENLTVNIHVIASEKELSKHTGNVMSSFGCLAFFWKVI